MAPRKPKAPKADAAAAPPPGKRQRTLFDLMPMNGPKTRTDPTTLNVVDGVGPGPGEEPAFEETACLDAEVGAEIPGLAPSMVPLPNDSLAPALHESEHAEPRIEPPAPSLPVETERVESNLRVRSLRPRKPGQLEAMKMYAVFEPPSSSRTQRTRPSASGKKSAGLASVASITSQTTPPSSSSIPQSSQVAAGQSSEDPILIESSPVKPLAGPIRIAGTTRVARNNDDTRLGTLRPHGPIDCAPFPKDIHVTGPQTAFTSAPSPFPRRALTASSALTMLDSPDVYSFPKAEATTKDTEQIASAPPAQTPLQPTDQKLILDAFLQSSEGHPAVQRLVQHAQTMHVPLSESTFGQEHMLWADKWRPVRAEEVLGNEDSARYLRDWLHTLQLGEQTPSEEMQQQPFTDDRTRRGRRGKAAEVSSRPTITRAVAKKRGRKRQRLDSDEEDDMAWIATDYDESDNGSSAWMSEDELFVQPPSAPPSEASVDAAVPAEEISTSLAPIAHSFHDRLTNTILLSGPSGCGKSAAVYACAAELGYEVFEVYPGIGRRSGAQLETLIGDVGKNHIVNTGEGSRHSKLKTSGNADERIRTLFGAYAKRPVQNPEHVPTMVSLSGITPDLSTERPPFAPVDANDTPSEVLLNPITSPLAPPAIAQSIILLEEVDVLFKEDAGFWPTVVNIIKDCRRPVVLTCNDPSLVPLNDLPLQCNLEFKSCPPPLAASFLWALALAESCSISHGDALACYESTYSTVPEDSPDIPLHPSTQFLPFHDLRRAIHALQMGPRLSRPSSSSGAQIHPSLTQRTSPSSEQSVASAAEGLGIMRQLAAQADDVSYVDAWLHRSPRDLRENQHLHSNEPCADDEVGFKIVYDEPNSLGWPQQSPAYYEYDEQLTRDILDRSHRARGAHAVACGLAQEACFSPIRARAAYQWQVSPILQRLIWISSPLLTWPSTFLDYDAWIRYMVRVDDALQAQTLAMAPGSQPGRRGRATRNSQATQYTRWIFLPEELRNVLAATAMRDL